jgi:hypothetical protein
MRRTTFALLFCAIAALLSACGSSDDSVGSLLSKTFSPDTSIKSGRLNAQLDANVQGIQGLNGPVRLRLSGPFQSGGKGQMPRFDFTLGLSAGGQTFTAGGVSTGDRGFVRFGGQAYAVSEQLFKQFRDGYLAAAKKSQKDKGSAPSLSTLGIQPRNWLRNARKAGEESVAGTTTIHIAAGIDVARLLDDVNRLLGRASAASGSKQVPQRLTDQQRQTIQNAVKSANVDIFTGKDDKLLRRLDVQIALKPSGKVKGGTVRFQLQLDALNKDQQIAAPANTKPLADLLAATGATGPTGSTGQTTTPTPAPSSGSSSTAYLQCLDKAKDDLNAVQQCASLLGR